MQEEEVATLLGRRAASPHDFANEVRARVRTDPVVHDLVALHAGLVVLASEHTIDYVHREIWGHRLRTLFFLQAPIDQMLMSPTTLHAVHPDRVVYFLAGALDHGADARRLACNATAHLRRLAADANALPELCVLLTRLAASDPLAIDMVLDDGILAPLAARMHAKGHVAHVTALCTAACPDLDLRLEPVVKRCARILADEVFTDRDDVHVIACLSFVERCVPKHRWHARLVPYLVRMSRHGWPKEFGALAAAALVGPSVELIVEMHRAHRLGHMVRQADVHARKGHAAWRAARALLRKAWPGMVILVLNEDGEIEGDATPYECPITLHSCVHPAVASDGRVYERDAILTHITKNGYVSPLTKETLYPYLHALRL